jgi:hypothetical protein
VQEGSLELARRGDGSVGAGVFHVFLQPFGQPQQHVQIDAHAVLDAGVLHLDDHGLTVVQPRA